MTYFLNFIISFQIWNIRICGFLISLKFYTRNIIPFLRFAKIVGKDSRLSYPFLDSSHELDKILKPKILQNPQAFHYQTFKFDVNYNLVKSCDEYIKIKQLGHIPKV